MEKHNHYSDQKMADAYFGGSLSIKIVDNPLIEDIEKENRLPVIGGCPAGRRDIGNPNFTPPGPVYHMLVVKARHAKLHHQRCRHAKRQFLCL